MALHWTAQKQAEHTSGKKEADEGHAGMGFTDGKTVAMEPARGWRYRRDHSDFDSDLPNDSKE